MLRGEKPAFLSSPLTTTTNRNKDNPSNTQLQQHSGEKTVKVAYPHRHIDSSTSYPCAQSDFLAATSHHHPRNWSNQLPPRIPGMDVGGLRKYALDPDLASCILTSHLTKKNTTPCFDVPSESRPAASLSKSAQSAVHCIALHRISGSGSEEARKASGNVTFEACMHPNLSTPPPKHKLHKPVSYHNDKPSSGCLHQHDMHTQGPSLEEERYLLLCSGVGAG